MKSVQKIKNNKGFTLVEMIVVILIIAILAAILIPGLLGYIDDAKKKQDVVEAKACLVSLQSELAKVYGLHSPKLDGSGKFDYDIFSYLDSKTVYKESQNIYLTNKKNVSEFTKNVFEKSGIEEMPYCIILYNFRVENVVTDKTNLRDAYTVYSMVYWKDKDRRPIFYNPDTNDWEEGSPYTAKLVVRGSKASSIKKKPNEILKGKYATRLITPYIIYRNTEDNSINNKNITEINKEIYRKMGLDPDKETFN